MAMMTSWGMPVNPSHPYLENDPAPSFAPTICAFHLGFSLVLQPQILAEVFQAALVVAVAGLGLMAPPPQRDHASTDLFEKIGCQINRYSSRRTSGIVNGIRDSSHPGSPPFCH